jgi:phosphatidylserine/phosphatidylglycerophosphate/cardiolipin synthase-like enzyme
VPFRPIRLSTLHLAQNRSHVRGIIIDGRIGWTGGFGIDDKWLGDGRTNGSWRETNVRFEGPAIRQLQAAFVAAWAEATGVMVTGHATVSPQKTGWRPLGSCIRLRRLAAPLPNGCSPCRSPAPERPCTSPTPTSLRSAPISTC